MAYQMTKEDITEMYNWNREDLLIENNLPKNTNFDDYVILQNYKMYRKEDLKKFGYEYVDENYDLLSRKNIQEFYDMNTDEEKAECYPTLDDYIEEGTSKNGTLQKLNFE